MFLIDILIIMIIIIISNPKYCLETADFCLIENCSGKF